MWDKLIGALPSKAVLLGVVLSFLVPYAVSKVNNKLHEFGDPPWKQGDDQGVLPSKKK